MPDQRRDAQRRGQIFWQKGNLPDEIVDAGCTGAAGGEETDVPSAKPPFFAAFRCNEHRSGDHDKRLILTDVPFVASQTTIRVIVAILFCASRLPARIQPGGIGTEKTGGRGFSITII